MKTDKIAIFLPDGIGIKNYLFSRLPQELINKGLEFIVIHSINESALVEVRERLKYDFKSYRLPNYTERVIEKFYRETATLSRLKYNTSLTGNDTIILSWNKKPASFLQKVFYYFVNIASNFISKSYTRILSIEKAYYRSINRNRNYTILKSFLKELGIGKILCTHQRAIIAAPLFQAAEELSGETYTVIYSWDNLPKARMILRADHYLVWSKYMKKEMLLFYPHIPPQNISITGTPQFEFYSDPKYFISREEFCRSNNLDPARKIICFSGDDLITSPYDPEYLRDLCESMLKIPETERPLIILRQSPVDTGERFQWVINAYPGMIKNLAPRWTFSNDKSNWALAYPSVDDICLLVNTARYSDAVVNLGSTMAHDFAMFNKPAYYLNYMPEKDHRSMKTKYFEGWNNEWIYRLQHFRSMPERSPVSWINSKNDFNKLIEDLKTGRNNNKEAQTQWLDKVVGFINIEKASNNIAELLAG
jgi:hypothetical protein